MKLKITKEIKQKYPNLRIGVVVGRGVKNRESDSNLEQFKRVSEEKLRASDWTSEHLVEHPFIAAWRETYRSFGAKPKEYTPTAESIIKRVLKGNDLPKINAIVDAYLAVELEHFLPTGGYDLDIIDGDITLKFSPGGESFTAIGGAKKQTKEGEVVYSDAKRVLTIKWNFLDCDETKITFSTENFILCIEAADAKIPTDSLEMATERLRKILEQFCPGTYQSFIANVSVNIDLTWEI